MSVFFIDVVQEQVTTGNVTIYTASAASNFESAHIIYANCANEGTVDTELTINIVQSGGVVAVTNRYFPPKIILAGQADPLTPLVGRVLKSGDFISSIGGLASNLNLSIGIKEIYTDT
ncbi:hypothetical protein KAR91_47205 [Candidatus Pacearchaeota archaeon]|nr:hypothetical protein [Candidatus Pacearchaeota archaeon]